MRAFRDNWYEKFDWLEYSVAKDSAFCFYCFLFKDNVKDKEVFTKIGMSNWKDALEKFRTHVGSVGSEHNKARIKFENYKKEKERLSFIAQSNKRREEARRTRLTATLDVIRFLLQQGLPMRERNELLKWYGLRNDEVGSVVLDDALETSQMISAQMQKDMVSACASETTLAILDDLGNRLFSILVNEAFGRMVVFIRYVNMCGQVVERFLGLVHVKETSTKCLKKGLDSLFLKHSLSLSRLRGQGYDASSYMREEFNGLKELILRENSCAWYMHCFAHQLQSIIVAICKANRYTCDFLNCLAMIVDACGSPCKRANELQQLEHIRNVSELENGASFSGNGKNSEACLKQQSVTRWGSIYTTLIRLTDMWPTVIQVLEDVFEDGIEHETSAWVRSLLKQMHSFEFVFPMILMKNLLGMTDKLSMVLEEGDQNIRNVISQIRCVKKDLHKFRDFGWDKLLEEVKAFCAVNQIPVINMEDVVPKLVRVKRDGKVVTNFHHYYAEIFSEVVQSVLEEMDHRFSEVSIELLDCLACLDLKNSFSNFDVDKLCRLANLYPNDFSRTDCSCLPQELRNFLRDMKEDKRFHDVDSLKSLARKMN